MSDAATKPMSARRYAYEREFRGQSAVYRDSEGYVLIVRARGYCRPRATNKPGVVTITNPSGKSISWAWEDRPPPDWKCTDQSGDDLARNKRPSLSAWHRLPIQERLNLEALHQAMKFETLAELFASRPRSTARDRSVSRMSFQPYRAEFR